MFGEDQFIASGVVYIPEGCSKPAKQSKDNSYVSGKYYQCGVLWLMNRYSSSLPVRSRSQCTRRALSWLLEACLWYPGVSLPLISEILLITGNEYKIENISKKEVQLFFAQARKIRMNEADEQAFEDFTEASRPRSASIPNVKQSRASVGTEGSDDSESEED